MCSILRYPYFNYFISSFAILAMANLPLFGVSESSVPSLEYLRRKHIEYSNYSNQNLNSFYLSGRIQNFLGEETTESVIKVFKKSLIN